MKKKDYDKLSAELKHEVDKAEVLKRQHEKIPQDESRKRLQRIDKYTGPFSLYMHDSEIEAHRAAKTKTPIQTPMVYDVPRKLTTPLPMDPKQLVSYLEADPRRVLDLAGEWLEVYRDCGVEPAGHSKAGGGFISATFALIKWAKAKGFHHRPLLALKEDLIAFQQTDYEPGPGQRPDAPRMAEVWETARRTVQSILEDAELSFRLKSAAPAAGEREAEPSAPTAPVAPAAESWDSPGLPKRLKSLYEALGPNPKKAHDLELGKLGEQPARIIGDYKKHKKWGKWLRAHVTRTGRGLYSRKV